MLKLGQERARGRTRLSSEISLAQVELSFQTTVHSHQRRVICVPLVQFLSDRLQLQDACASVAPCSFSSSKLLIPGFSVLLESESSTMRV